MWVPAESLHTSYHSGGEVRTSVAAKDVAIIVLAEFLSSQLPTFFPHVFIIFHDFLYFFITFLLLPTLYFDFCLYFSCS